MTRPIIMLLCVLTASMPHDAAALPQMLAADSPLLHPKEELDRIDKLMTERAEYFNTHGMDIIIVADGTEETREEFTNVKRYVLNTVEEAFSRVGDGVRVGIVMYHQDAEIICALSADEDEVLSTAMQNLHFRSSKQSRPDKGMVAARDMLSSSDRSGEHVPFPCDAHSRWPTVVVSTTHVTRRCAPCGDIHERRGRLDAPF
jgi:hypothetical protein